MKKVRAEGSETGVRSPAKQDEGKAQKRTSRRHGLEECGLATLQPQRKGVRLALCLRMCQPNRAWHGLPMPSGSGLEDPASADGDQHGTGGQGGKHQHGEKEKRKKPNEKKQGRVLLQRQHQKASAAPIAVSTASLCSAATGCDAWHWATTSRAQPSQQPHWVATPSSNWISSKPMPARAWRAISRSETRRQTQTIMAVVSVKAGNG